MKRLVKALKIIQRNHLAQQENEQQLIKQQEQTLENEYQLALKHIESAIRLSDLDYPANYFKELSMNKTF